MFRPMLEAIPHTDVAAVAAQFETEGHVSMRGLVDPELLEQATSDIRSLSTPTRTHNEGRRETVTQLYMPDADKEANLYAVLQGVQEGAAIIGGALSLTRGCQLDLKQMDRNTVGFPQRNRRSLVGGVVANIAVEGASYYSLRDKQRSESRDYIVRPGDIVFEAVNKGLIHRSYTGDEARTLLAVANNVRALANDPAEAETPRSQEAS